MERAPGIGNQGEITISNEGTRAVLVNSQIASLGELCDLSHYLLIQPPSVNRRLIKSITRQRCQLGASLDGDAMVVEACIPFSYDGGETLYWTVIGINTGERTPNPAIINRHKQLIKDIGTDLKYQPQSGSELLAFAKKRGLCLQNLSFDQINPDNFDHYEQSLKMLYGLAFDKYPYDPVEAIKESCASNIFVVATNEDQQEVVSVTGAEFMTIQGISVAEVGDSASLPNLSGLGAVMKRLLMQTMYQSARIPALLFTDSRISDDGAVLKANRRAGFMLDPDIILPWHTSISSSNRDP